MTCNPTLLQLYLDGRLIGENLLGFLDHVERCRKCRRARTFYVAPGANHKKDQIFSKSMEDDVTKTKQILEAVCNSNKPVTSAAVFKLLPELGFSGISSLLGQLVKRGDLSRFKGEDRKFQYCSNGYDPAAVELERSAPHNDKKSQPDKKFLMGDTPAMLEAVMKRYDEMEEQLQESQQQIIDCLKQIRELEAVIADRDDAAVELDKMLATRRDELEQLKAGAGAEHGFRKWFSSKGLTA